MIGKMVTGGAVFLVGILISAIVDEKKGVPFRNIKEQFEVRNLISEEKDSWEGCGELMNRLVSLHPDLDASLEDRQATGSAAPIRRELYARLTDLQVDRQNFDILLALFVKCAFSVDLRRELKEQKQKIDISNVFVRWFLDKGIIKEIEQYTQNLNKFLGDSHKGEYKECFSK